MSLLKLFSLAFLTTRNIRSTSNYHARKFGVRAGMPGFIGRKLCPDLVLVKPDFVKYRRDAEKIRSVFREYDPNFSPMSLDEAYLDLTDYLRAREGEQRCDHCLKMASKKQR